MIELSRLAVRDDPAASIDTQPDDLYAPFCSRDWRLGLRMGREAAKSVK